MPLPHTFEKSNRGKQEGARAKAQRIGWGTGLTGMVAILDECCIKKMREKRGWKEQELACANQSKESAHRAEEFVPGSDWHTYTQHLNQPHCHAFAEYMHPPSGVQVQRRRCSLLTSLNYPHLPTSPLPFYDCVIDGTKKRVGDKPAQFNSSAEQYPVVSSVRRSTCRLN